MRRHTVIKRIIQLLKENDVIILSGQGVCNSAFEFDDKRMFYFDKVGYAMSFSIGLAMTTNKRVFVICEDIELIRSYSLMAQAAKSRCPNLFYLVLGCGRYQDSGGQPSIVENLNKAKGVLFKLGMTVYDFSFHFSPNGSMKELQNLFDHLRGPQAVLIKLTIGVDKVDDYEVDDMEMKNRFEEFVQDLELGTSLFVP